jgi:hypothetical protein
MLMLQMLHMMKKYIVNKNTSICTNNFLIILYTLIPVIIDKNIYRYFLGLFWYDLDVIVFNVLTFTMTQFKVF